MTRDAALRLVGGRQDMLLIFVFLREVVRIR
jgi:hypothetical protein